MARTILVEAETLQQARDLARQQIPEGYIYLSEKVMEEGAQRVIEERDATVELALAAAEGKLPPDALIYDRIITKPECQTVHVRARTPSEARAQAKWQADAHMVQDVRMVDPGRSGFLGLGRVDPEYEVVVMKPARATIRYARKPRLELRIASRAELLEEQLRQTCSVCGMTKEQIKADIRRKQAMGILVITHDRIGYCDACQLGFCSQHYPIDELTGAHTCPRCHSDLFVERTGWQ